MKISIITINYNNKSGLEKTIKSITNQTFLDYELIIIDGGSTDGSANVIEEYSDNINYWVSEPDNGIYDAMNKGIASAKGEFICFLNSGDLYFSIYSIEVVAKFIESSNLSLFFSNYLFVNEEKKITKICDVDLINDRSDLLNDTFGHLSTFYSKELFTKIGNFDTSNRIVSDVEWYLNAIIKYKVEFTHINFISAVFFDGGISSSSDLVHRMERKKMIDKFFTKREVMIFSGRTFNLLKRNGMFKKLLSTFFNLTIKKKIR